MVGGPFNRAVGLYPLIHNINTFCPTPLSLVVYDVNLTFASDYSASLRLDTYMHVLRNR